MQKDYRFVFLLFFHLLATSTSFAQEKTIKIGSGIITGSYYPVAQQICKIIENNLTNSYKCQVIQTKGTLENLKLLANHEIDFAIVQADVANEFYLGHANSKDNENIANFRSISNLFIEVFTMITRKDDKINDIRDLRRKTILTNIKVLNNSSPISMIANFYSWPEDSNPIIVERELQNAEEALCDGSVDAIVTTMYHPNAFISQIAQKCEIDFLSLNDELREFIYSKRPYFHEALIEGNLYPGILESKKSVGTRALLLTTTRTSSEIVKLLLDNLWYRQHNTRKLLYSLQTTNFNISFSKETHLPLHSEALKIIEELNDDISN
ncbi:MAG: hypothetical protein K0Q51_450 [Rickettsiaceae bacterium]|nr:hypothetical protein [Rickettsiaceae bacterium]